MANIIELFKQYVPILDLVYQGASTTAFLDGNQELAQAGASANELVIPRLKMDGLGDYDRNKGYPDGDVSMDYQTVPVDYDRGRMFTVDTMDNAETAGIAFGRLAGEFIRTKVVPELDAYRYARYCGKAVPENIASATISSGEALIKALRAGADQMDEAQVSMNDRHLFITPTNYGMISDLDTTKSREVLGRFASITQVPQVRFYTAVTLYNGREAGEKAGSYKKAAGGMPINFMIMQREAVIQFTKHLAPKVVTPEQNQDADAWKFGYRIVGVHDVYEQKNVGIYVHHAS